MKNRNILFFCCVDDWLEMHMIIKESANTLWQSFYTLSRHVVISEMIEYDGSIINCSCLLVFYNQYSMHEQSIHFFISQKSFLYKRTMHYTSLYIVCTDPACRSILFYRSMYHLC